MTIEHFADPAPAVDPSIAETAADMQALVRVLFGVGGLERVSLIADPEPTPAPAPAPSPGPVPHDRPPTQSEAAAPPTLPAPPPHPEPEPERRSAPTIPLSGPSPLSGAPFLPSAALPFSDIPVADSLPGPTTHRATDAAGTTHRRPGGPTPELLEELAFLDE